MEKAFDLLFQVGVGAAIAAIASWITVRLSLGRFVSEKWWEKKAEAYSAILESLHHMRRAFEEDLRAAETGRDIPKDLKDELTKKYRLAHDELLKRVDVWQFTLSERAGAIADKLKKDLDCAGSSEPHSWHPYIEDSWVALDTALKDMRELAREELINRWTPKLIRIKRRK